MEDALAKPSFIDTLRTVMAGAIGIRRKSDHERAPLNPVHLAVAAVAFVVLFIFTLLTIIKLVLS
jgi:cell division protein FtsB